VSNTGGATIGFSYVYDSLGRKTSETLASGAIRTFSYDAAGQLISEGRNTGPSYTTTYTYDAAGNRLSRATNGTTENYSYDNANKLLTAGSKSYTYDLAGNTVSVTNGSNVTNLTWDGAGRIKTIVGPNGLSNTNVYNGLGQRVSVIDSTGTRNLVLADDSIDSSVLSDGQATYQYAAGLVSEVRGGASKVLHSDSLGTTRAKSVSSGVVSDTLETDAFGNTIGSSGSVGAFGFAGQHGYQSDKDTGLQLGRPYRFGPGGSQDGRLNPWPRRQTPDDGNGFPVDSGVSKKYPGRKLTTQQAIDGGYIKKI
jgi:YD repeat-containing protein